MNNVMNNVDPIEIEKFSEGASRWWDTHSEFKPLHQINPARLGYIESKHTLPQTKIVDIGCGGGILAESMAAKGADVLGIDMSSAALQVAKLHALESGVKISYQESTAEALAKNNANAFDIVTCMEMLEHVPDPAQIVQACADLVKPGGLVFFSTINRNAKAYALAIVGAEYLMQMLPKGTHTYRKFIKPSELARSARQAGLEIIETAGISYHPVYGEFQLTRNVDVNYLMCCRK